MANWLVHAERIETADMIAPFRVFQKFIPNPVLLKDIRLKAIRTWFVIYNNPSFTSIEMRLYSIRSDAPFKLLATSNTILKADIHTLSHACKEIGFEFEDAIALEAQREYIIVPYINGYTGTTSSHIAWRKAYEDIVYTEGVDLEYVNLLVRPYQMALIGERI